jgi:hypothetical protein
MKLDEVMGCIGLAQNKDGGGGGQALEWDNKLPGYLKWEEFLDQMRTC